MEQNEFPTRSNLIYTQHTLALARQGYELLDQKRNILMRELTKQKERAKEIHERTYEISKTAKASIVRANIKMGAADVTAAVYSTPLENSVEIYSHNLMSVEIPLCEYKDKTLNKPPYSFSDTVMALDEAYVHFNELKKLLISKAAMENTIFRIETSIEKTQKRANALQHIIIPKYEARLKFIQDTLEERERDGYVRMKLGKRANVK